ncbi:MAG: glycosyltransferase family protein [Phycisphaerales bacterium]
MSETVWIPDQYSSQFGLLGAMAHELRDAFEEQGHDARIVSIDEMQAIETGILFFMNTPSSIAMLPRALFEEGSGLRAIQYLVDHPFAMPDAVIDAWTKRSGLHHYRLCLPCADDVHLLRSRFPGLVHRWVPHGIPRDSLCPMEQISREAHAAREFDVVVTGSVWPQAQLDGVLGGAPPELAAMAREMAHLMVHDPSIGYVAAADLVMGTRGVITGEWKTLKLLWALVVAMVNRQRRLAVVASLQGLRVGVFGSAAWEPECTGTISYCGEVEYASCAEAFGRGRVALAWGPTQFVHSYSERIMQAMASGARVVADNRLLVRQDFKDTCSLFDWSDASNARGAVEQVLHDDEAGIEMARRGRSHVEAHCLWSHRIETMLSI